MKKTDYAWITYDFANSAYALVVMTLFYPLFFVQFVAPGESAESVWGAVVALSMLIVAILAPTLGSLFDRRKNRKKALLVTTVFLSFFIAALAFTADVSMNVGLAIFVITNATFGVALFLYDSILVDARPTKQNVTLLSGIGWALGYVGGPLCVLITYFVLNSSVPSVAEDYKMAFLIVAAFFGFLAIPAVLFMAPEIKEKNEEIDTKPKLFWLVRNWKENKQIVWFLAAIYLISDGLITIVYFISLYSKNELGLSLEEIVFFLTLVQVIGIPATILFSYIGHKIGEIRVLIVCSFIWCAIIALLYSTSNPDSFYLIALLTGLVVGSTPAVARGYLAKIVPTAHRAEIFGFNAFASRFASILGPILFVVVAAKFDQRAAMLSILPFFLLGIVLLAVIMTKFENPKLS